VPLRAQNCELQVQSQKLKTQSSEIPIDRLYLFKWNKSSDIISWPWKARAKLGALNGHCNSLPVCHSVALPASRLPPLARSYLARGSSFSRMPKASLSPAEAVCFLRASEAALAGLQLLLLLPAAATASSGRQDGSARAPICRISPVCLAAPPPFGRLNGTAARSSWGGPMSTGAPLALAQMNWRQQWPAQVSSRPLGVAIPKLSAPLANLKLQISHWGRCSVW